MRGDAHERGATKRKEKEKKRKKEAFPKDEEVLEYQSIYGAKNQSGIELRG
jgi:hypothetical protein